MVYALDNFDLEAERIRIDILKVDRSLGRDLTDGQFSDCSFPYPHADPEIDMVYRY